MAAPEWVTHLFYAIHISALLYFECWYAGGSWAFIWIFSYLIQRRINKP